MSERNTNTDYISSLEKQMEELQQRSRSSVIEVRNIPENEHETKRDLINVVKNLAHLRKYTFKIRIFGTSISVLENPELQKRE